MLGICEGSNYTVHLNIWKITIHWTDKIICTCVYVGVFMIKWNLCSSVSGGSQLRPVKTWMMYHAMMLWLGHVGVGLYKACDLPTKIIATYTVDLFLQSTLHKLI